MLDFVGAAGERCRFQSARQLLPLCHYSSQSPGYQSVRKV